MKKLLLETSFSKIYMIVMIIITLLIVGGYFSYAMFTVSREKGNAISIVTGNLTYKLEVDGKESSRLVVPAHRSSEFKVTLTNPNNRIARFNFYYIGEVSNDVNIGYLESDGYNVPPKSVGINLEKSGSSGSSNIYRILVENESNNDLSMELGVQVGLDYNDLSLPSNGHLFEKIQLSSILQQLVDNNEVKTEKVNMFNYTSNGDIFTTPYNGTTENDPNYLTNGLYTMDDEDGISYYFRGNIDNNNVQFGEYEDDYYVYSYGDMYFQSLESCKERYGSCNASNSSKIKLASKGDKIYWKIIRLNGDGTLRLIYNGTPTNQTVFTVGIVSYDYRAYDPKYTGYTFDRDTNETDSFIKKEVDTWYNNTIGANSNYDNKVVEEKFCSDSSGYKLASDYGFNVSGYENTYMFAIDERLGMAAMSFSKPNSPTLKCPKTTETYGGSYNLKVGLITADELALAGEGILIKGNSYLYAAGTGQNYWTMTPSAFNSNSDKAYIKVQDASINETLGSNSFAVRPVINISVDNGFTSGDGTTENPYVITAE